MGYSTSFEGQFNIDKKLDDQTTEFLMKLSSTRRMKRDNNLLPKTGFEKYGFESWGIDGEFYVDSGGEAGQARETSIKDYNSSSAAQPGLWCDWIITEDRLGIKWGGGEKFYYYVEWLEYIIEKVLKPRNYVLSGMVSYQGEEYEDFGQIKVKNNEIFLRYGKKEYGDWKEK